MKDVSIFLRRTHYKGLFINFKLLCITQNFYDSYYNLYSIIWMASYLLSVLMYRLLGFDANKKNISYATLNCPKIYLQVML
jgi:hypothetical protein